MRRSTRIMRTGTRVYKMGGWLEGFYRRYWRRWTRRRPLGDE